MAFEHWLAADHAERCASCGTKETDWIDPTSRRAWVNPMWDVKVAPCTGCGRIHAARSEATDGLDDDERATLRVRLKPNLDDDTPDLHPG